ncbi:hypothetical protein [Priestia koreensis]|uniref:hypothetical protein n=1 Tax=Priestia koreensis TaxID=284581 RepID=UPI00203F16B0|nr:hypothetical protein [Priestia koreensis]MCM3003307.1 hypothetical protein [Priestia koreensis]
MKEEIDSLNKPAGLLFGKRETHKDEFGLIIQKHSAKLYTGKRIKVSLCLKTEQASRCKVWLQVNDLYDDVITFNSLHEDKIKETTNWSTYSFVTDVSDERSSILLGVQLIGRGKVWVSNFRFQEVDMNESSKKINILPSMPVNLDFSE